MTSGELTIMSVAKSDEIYICVKTTEDNFFTQLYIIMPVAKSVINYECLKTSEDYIHNTFVSVSKERLQYHIINVALGVTNI